MTGSADDRDKEFEKLVEMATCRHPFYFVHSYFKGTMKASSCSSDPSQGGSG